eukprot:gb/GEZJ01007123.1/.p1 GENE.gb/GEZJ01007123.1/~~gb/GEZJ01007123.1/.p1  ORF type:complete len:263 (+),score=21.60 gb/GEZJ01007123.1/:257-1045(+)
MAMAGRLLVGARDALLARPHTTVIIATYNEEETIGRTIAALRHHSRNRVQIIVADGNSRDKTGAQARAAGAQVVRTTGGRGAQFNVGAQHARAETLLFLHADSIVCNEFDAIAHATLSKLDTAAGAYSLRIDSETRGVRVVEKMVRWRSALLQRPYGDQGLFMRRATFSRVGGFPCIPFLDDYEMVRRLRRVGRVRTTACCVRTRGLRWDALGVARTAVVNQLVLGAYHVGADPAVLRRCYYAVLHAALAARALRRRRRLPL